MSIFRVPMQLQAFLIPLIIYLLSMNGVTASDHPDSILAMQFSMWTNHSFSLGPVLHPIDRGIDVSIYQGNVYSAIAPGFALMSFPFAVIGFILDGNVFNIFGYAMLMDELFLALASSISAFIVYKICLFYARPAQSLLASLTLAFGTSVWPFTTLIFGHAAAMMFSVISVYCLLNYTKNGRPRAYMYFAGLALGIASLVEYVSALLIVPISAYLLFASNKNKHYFSGFWKGKIEDVVSLFILFFLVASVNLFYNSLIFSNPLVFPEQLWVNAQSQGGLGGRFSIDGMAEQALFYLVSPFRGLLLLSPILALGFLGIYRMIRFTIDRKDAILLLGLFLAILLPYSYWSGTGGLSYGPRYMIVGIPYLVIPIAVSLTNLKQSSLIRYLFIFLFAISSLIQAAGALAGALSGPGDTLTYQPLSYNLPWLFQGQLNSWLTTRLPIPQGIGSLIFDLAILISVWSFGIFYSKFLRGNTITVSTISSMENSRPI